MKKIILLSAGLFFSVGVMAAEAPFSTAPAPTQVYSSVTASQQPAPVVSPAAVSTVSPTPNTADTTTNSAAVINSAGIDTSAQGQASQLAQDTLVFEKQTDQHIQDLRNSNQVIGTDLQTINQTIAQLQQTVNQLQVNNTSIAGHFFSHHNLIRLIEFGGIAAFLLLFGVLMGRLMHRSSAIAVTRQAAPHSVGDLLADDTKSEYDFMNTYAAIPAKLDLARSYMAMNDHEQAAIVLKTVLEKGNEEQRMVAEALLTKIQKMT